ncbi:hypothetical protein COCMIDRAFT_32722 [Bipolaris oryzae ATCC 44560]|uniref:Uncharacterized protein n=1 Tax=Bipolaris oryzae ATCC 44560 TaxID=930090 RepID=W6ZR04_COCMI|nr:uncharacterized protein COCMIDRAFT_32722 [Bipolaris oryzae ATCC 44560]EUC49929.1 hypothetical protein COCMIDRAFT_32722 [Bipolaris oryzae ATCC 44560]
MGSRINLDHTFQLAKTPAVIAAGGAFVGWFVVSSLNSWYSRRVVNNAVTDKMYDWSKEIVLLTGGNSGIGAAIAAKLAERAVKVINVDIAPPKGRTCKQEILDITSSSEIASIGAQIRAEHGAPTVLINNAGVGNAVPILQLAETKLHTIFQVNFLPDMVKADHGHIVSIASLASFSTQALNVDYSVTKASVLALHEGLAQELKFIYKAPRVRTTIVHPGWVRTPMAQKWLDSGKITNGLSEPEDVANAVVKQLYSGYAAQIIIPSYFWWIPLVRGLPSWLQESARDVASKVLLNADE